MSDWREQTETLVNTWAKTQKKLWDNWFEAVNVEKQADHLEEERKKVLKSWQTSVEKGLAAQAEWARLWNENMPQQDAPEAFKVWTSQVQDMMKQWTSSQEDFSKVWFEMLNRLDTSSVNAKTWEAQGEKLMQAWKEAADKALEAQKDMSEAWTQTAKKA